MSQPKARIVISVISGDPEYIVDGLQQQDNSFSNAEVVFASAGSLIRFLLTEVANRRTPNLVVVCAQNEPDNQEICQLLGNFKQLPKLADIPVLGVYGEELYEVVQTTVNYDDTTQVARVLMENWCRVRSSSSQQED